MTLPIYVITGASKGIGRSLAIQMSQQGYTVFALARPSAELAEVEGVLKASSKLSMSVECDLGDLDSIAFAAKTIDFSAKSVATFNQCIKSLSTFTKQNKNRALGII